MNIQIHPSVTVETFIEELKEDSNNKILKMPKIIKRKNNIDYFWSQGYFISTTEPTFADVSIYVKTGNK